MSAISVTPDQLRTKAGTVKTRAETAQGDFDALKGQLADLTTVFTGKAQQAFDARYEEWNTHARGLIEALESLGQFLQVSADAIEDTDSQLASGLGS